MKAAIAIAAASAAVANAIATPAQVDTRPNKRASGSVPTVTVRGNGTAHLEKELNCHC